ncbi:unnamed protein product [Didymodactylos carnosus]|uniref:Uncharacterized protein n=1 Tax=Didymodactylos carnosus TaxID=1234261 RepID=A0A815EJT9_9BILA|nr:unnamed protein product [Didymodactylos carnosus]CAF1312909.1 unnamed protein product [Didymodactylos carnosus]CAF3930437.1 unnamed protein product [Didymodactylos carnosus]CAF4152030.1 unnamed protein product [Didymodactylos carnosus]
MVDKSCDDELLDAVKRNSVYYMIVRGTADECLDSDNISENLENYLQHCDESKKDIVRYSFETNTSCKHPTMLPDHIPYIREELNKAEPHVILQQMNLLFSEMQKLYDRHCESNKTDTIPFLKLASRILLE